MVIKVPQNFNIKDFNDKINPRTGFKVECIKTLRKMDVYIISKIN